MIELELPWPPSVNHYYRYTPGGVRLTDAGLAFRRWVNSLVMARRSPRISGRLSLEVVLCPPDHRRHDIDNFAKSVCDALQHAGVFENDEQIDELLLRRGPVGGLGVARVKLRTLA